MSIAITFPGQGAQARWLGRPWIDHPAWSVVTEAEEATGLDLAHLLLDAPEDALADTRNSQLVVLLASLLAWRALEPRLGGDHRSGDHRSGDDRSGDDRSADDRCEVVAVAGHSLGQITALIAAGVLGLDEGVRLAVARAESTAAAQRDRCGGLVALLGADVDLARAACGVASERAWVANVNAPGQVVVGGDVDVLEHVASEATLVADDPDDAIDAVIELLDHLPDNHLTEAPHGSYHDPAQRACTRAASAVPIEGQQSYDVRDVLVDVFDADTFLEVHADHAPNLVCAYAHLDGRSVAVVANQPAVRAGTLDIAASCKAARHIQHADAFGLPIITFVDTPGYEPGRDLEWRGMIRHGAKLAHAYAEATVPRVGVVLRKAYGGAYIVMDSRTMGNDLTLAWPTAEIAVMGAPGAVAILDRRTIAAADDPDATRLRLEAAYRDRYCSPAIAAERGYVDEVIDPADTRRHLAAGVRRLADKQPVLPNRRHANGPL